MANKLTDNSGNLEPNLSGIDAEIDIITPELDNPVDEYVRVSDILDQDGNLTDNGLEDLAKTVEQLAKDAKPTYTATPVKENPVLKGIPSEARHILSRWSYTAPFNVKEFGDTLRYKRDRQSQIQKIAQSELNYIISAARDAKFSPIPKLFS